MTPRPPAGTGPVVCLGETMAAMAPEPVGALESAGLLRVDVAGAESNVAVYLADHGIPARWVSALGDDPFGRLVKRHVAAGGVDVSGVRTDPLRPTGLLFKDPGPDSTRVHYYRGDSAAAALGPGLLADGALGGARLLHLTGITPALSPSCRALVEAALADDRPWPVSFDVNHRPALWTGAPEPASDVLRTLADRADLVFVGLDEARALWGAGLTPDGVRALLPRPGTLVVKDGDRAATAYTPDGRHTVRAPRVDVVEPVGAGDAFAAGYLAGVLRGDGPVPALRRGHLTAASALRVTGDHGTLPPPDTTARLLAADPATWTAH
ncbi:sugar kinase [Streptomyces sp. NPDC047002]|uniref:sugar kinase n=1 Tax=Streptomyces sp. NPDC047002 TaxID=3155475 RepID=UPI00345134E7